MQFISYDSDSSSEKPVVAIVEKKCNAIPSTTNKSEAPLSWTLLEGSSDDDSVNGGSNIAGEIEPTDDSTRGKLIDAELLFATASSKPKFLSRNMDEKFEVEAVKQHSYDKTESLPTHIKQKPVSTSSGAQPAPAKGAIAAKSVPKPDPIISAADQALKKKLDDRETLKVSLFNVKINVYKLGSSFEMTH